MGAATGQQPAAAARPDAHDFEATADAPPANRQPRPTVPPAQPLPLGQQQPATSAPQLTNSRTQSAKPEMLTNGQFYQDLGSDYYRRRDPARTTKRLIAQLEALGHAVTLQEAAA